MRLLTLSLMVVLIVNGCALLAVEGPLIEIDPLVPVPQHIPLPDGEEPGRVAPVAPAKQLAIEFSWDGYHTLVVVGDGVGLMRPAWVATYEAPVVLSGDTANLAVPLAGLFGYHRPLAVAYRAQAFLDAQGRLHIDARKAVISGPQAGQWFADSFRFVLTNPATVETIDDQDSSNQGTVDCVIDPAVDPALFDILQTRVQVLVGDGI